MKKSIILLALMMSGFLSTSATNPGHNEPITPKNEKVELAPTDDLSEFCTPDWSGYDTLSPDISTRPFLYPNKNDKKKMTKKAKKVKKTVPLADSSMVIFDGLSMLA